MFRKGNFDMATLQPIVTKRQRIFNNNTWSTGKSSKIRRRRRIMTWHRSCPGNKRAYMLSHTLRSLHTSHRHISIHPHTHTHMFAHSLTCHMSIAFKCNNFLKDFEKKIHLTNAHNCCGQDMMLLLPLLLLLLLYVVTTFAL